LAPAAPDRKHASISRLISWRTDAAERNQPSATSCRTSPLVMVEGRSALEANQPKRDDRTHDRCRRPSIIRSAGPGADGTSRRDRGRNQGRPPVPDADVDLASDADLSWASFTWHNLVPVTIGNMIGGGLLVGLVYWFVYLRHDPT